MKVDYRVVAACAGIAVLVAGGLSMPAFFPAAFADEPQSHLLDTARDLFPPPFDPGRLKKFDVTIDDSVSTTPLSTQHVAKIGFGHRSVVDIVTTASGTYSSDGIASPNVFYPGIHVTPKGDARERWGFADVDTGAGRWTATFHSRGSFTYLDATFTPSRRM